jgi:hypothetical protein
MPKRETRRKVRSSSIPSRHGVVPFPIILFLTPRTCRYYLAFHSTILARSRGFPPEAKSSSSKARDLA